MISFFFHSNLTFGKLRNNADVRRCLYFEVGTPVVFSHTCLSYRSPYLLDKIIS